MNSIGLSITLKFDRTQYKAKDRQNLRFVLTNDLDKKVSVLKWHTPFEGFNSDMFRVEKKGELAVYLGREVKRGVPKPEDYVTIEPKGSISVDLNLTDAYDIFEVGDYNVEFVSRLLDVGWEDPQVLSRKLAAKRKFVPKKVSSNVARFKLLENRKPRQLKGVAIEKIAELKKIAEKVTPTFKNCSQNRQNELNNALDEAEKIAGEAKLTLSSTRESSRAESVRYITWFGNYDKSRYDKVTSNFDKILDALANKNITFNCDCNEDYYAYVYPTKPYEIFLCKQFWSAPLTGTDSKAGTIVHETSHFNVVASTDDHVYGQGGCQQLAIDNPSDAIDNADSHEYFAENNPPLSMGGGRQIISPRVPARSQVGVVSRSTDKLDIFVTDRNGVIFTAAWEPAFTDWWHGWWELNGGRAAPGAPVHGVSRSTDKLDVFVIGTDNRIYTAAWEPAFTDWWHGWWQLKGGIAAPGAHVTVVSRNTDKLDAFVVGTDGRIYTAAWEPGFTDWWHGWWPIGNIRAPQGAPVHAVSRSADKLDIFITDVNGVIQTAAWEPAFTDGWHGWWELNGGRAAPGAPVTAVSRSADKLDVFVVGTDGRIYTAAWEPGFTDWWHGWWPIGNIRAPQGAPVHAVSRSADKLDIFVTDVNGVIQTAAWEPAFTDWWHGWWELNGGRAAPGAPVTAVSRSADKLDVFVIGSDGRVWTAAWEPSFPDWWHGWWPIGE